MSGIGNKIASVVIQINGKQEAINDIDAIKTRAKELRNELKSIRELKDVAGSNNDGKTFSQLAAREKEVQTAITECTKAVSQYNKDMKQMDTLMQDLDKKTLKQLQADLKLAKQKFRVIDSKDLAALQKGKEVISAIQGTISRRQSGGDLSKTLASVRKELGDIKTTPLERLRDAQQRLTDAINNSKRGTVEYKQAVEQLKGINRQIDTVTGSFQQQDSMITKTMKRLASYVAVYMGFNQLIGKAKEIISGNIALSDSIADIQKVTKMTTEQVDALANEIDALDTRSAQEQLYQLGYQAGMLGLHSTQDILGFIKAADQMNWALKELGEDGAVQLMKVANLTHETDIYGVEEALNKVGSAINEITASSASSAAPIVDYVSRLGSVGATAGYTSSQLVAIGSTLDSLGVHAEMGSTAVNKFIIALQSNKSGIADKLGMSHDQMEQIEQTRGSIGLMVEVLERLREMGGTSANAMAVLDPIFKDLGSDGQRMITTMTTLIQNVDTFKDHLEITSDAFDEGVSMLNEYNVKNETAAATFERLGNAIRENWVNSGAVRWLQDVGKYLSDVVTHTNRHVVVLGVLKTALMATYGYMAGLLIKGAVAAVGALGAAWSTLVGYVGNVSKAYKVNYTANILLQTAQKEGIVLTKAEAVASAELAVAEGTATTATFSLTASLKALWAAMASNPLTSVLALVGALVGAVIALKDAIWEETDAEKAMRDAQEEVTKSLTAEQNALSKVYEKLEIVKGSDKERKKLIAEINAKYKDYLPNLLNEKAGYDEIKKSLAEVNRQLEINAALKLKAKLDEAAGDTLAKAVSDIRASAATNIDKLIDGWESKLRSGKTMAELKGALQAVIQQAADAGLSGAEVEKKIRQTTNKYADVILSPYEEYKISDIADDVEKLRGAQETYNQTLKDNENYAAGALGGMENYRKIVEAQAQAAIGASGATEQFGDQVKQIGVIAGQEPTKLKEWYDALIRVGKMATDSAEYKNILSDLFSEAELKTVLDANGKVIRDKATKLVTTTRETIKNELASQGFTTELSHKSPGKDSHKDPSAQVKKDVQNAFNYLKAYYNEEEAKWLRYRKEHPTMYSQEQTDDEIRKTKEQYEAAFQQLSQFLLKKNNEFLDNAPVMDYFAQQKMDVKDLRDRVQKDGQQIWDDITKNMTDAQRKELESMVKHLNEIQKLIEKYDFVAQAEHSLQEGLVKNQLFYDQYYDDMKRLAEEGTNLTAAELKKRYKISEDDSQALLILLSDYHDQYLEAIKKQNERATKLTKLGYKEQQTEWNEHIKQMDSWANQMHEHESAMGTDNKYSLELEMNTLRLKEAAQQEYIDILRQQLTDEWSLRLGFSEKILAEAEAIENRKAELRASSLGGEDIESIIANDPEILASQARLQAMRDEIETRIALSTEYQNAQQALTSIQEEEAQKQIEIEDRMKEAWKKYQDIIADGSYEVGEKLGDLFTADDREKAVENLREAGKDILKEMTKQTMQMVQQWIMRRIQKAAIRKAELIADQAADRAEIASDQAKNLAISTGNASAVLSKMTVKASETTATAMAGISQGTSNAMSIGPWGAALVPIVVSLITGALITGISAIGKGKQEVTAETGVSDTQASAFAKRKVAAGMFTYAEGRYPVLANDGETYNAKYENRVHTGLYNGPHMAVFGEKGMEMVIDGQTTRNMMQFRPDLYQDILSLRDGNIRQRARAYADGRYLATVPTGNSGMSGNSGNTGQPGNSTLSDLAEATRLLYRTLEGGIYARLVEDFSEDGTINRMEQDRQWMKDHGLLKS